MRVHECVFAVLAVESEPLIQGFDQRAPCTTFFSGISTDKPPEKYRHFAGLCVTGLFKTPARASAKYRPEHRQIGLHLSDC